VRGIEEISRSAPRYGASGGAFCVGGIFVSDDGEDEERNGILGRYVLHEPEVTDACADAVEVGVFEAVASEAARACRNHTSRAP